MDDQRMTYSMAGTVSRLDALRLLFTGHIKDIVYRQCLETISELKTKIRQAVQSINGDILREVYKNMEACLSFLVRGEGGHFEHLIN